MYQFTKEQATAIYNSGEWKDWTDEEIVKFQLYQDRLCVPFRVYHKALSNVLGRPILSIEFGRPEMLREEYEGKRHAPTLDEILSLIPEEKRLVIGI